MVDVKVDTEDIEKKPESFFTAFDAVRFLVLSLLGESGKWKQEWEAQCGLPPLASVPESHGSEASQACVTRSAVGAHAELLS